MECALLLVLRSHTCTHAHCLAHLPILLSTPLQPPQAVRYNYSRGERLAMVELLAMVNDVHGQLDRMASRLIPEIKCDMVVVDDGGGGSGKTHML